MAELSEKAKALFEGPNLMYVATLNGDGSPQVTPVWADFRDGRIRFNTPAGSAKERNLRRNPRVAASIVSRDDPFHKADIRGRVVDFVAGAEADAHIDELSERYLGRRPYPWHREDQQRLIVVIEPERVYEG